MSAYDPGDNRYAVYLIPPYEVASAVARAHAILRKQFGFIAASKFQVHATIKGFFKRSEGPVQPIIKRLDQVFASQQAFPIHFCGFHIDDDGIGLDISCVGKQPNKELLAFREAIVTAIRPFIAPDCDFIAKDLGQPFKAHITLVFRDIPLPMQREILDYLSAAPLPQTPFMADTFHFLEFSSDDWEGHWEQTLSWRLLKTWHTRRVEL